MSLTTTVQDSHGDPPRTDARLWRLRALHDRMWSSATYEVCVAYDELLAEVAAEAGVAVPGWDTQRGGAWTAETRALVERGCREARAFH